MHFGRPEVGNLFLGYRMIEGPNQQQCDYRLGRVSNERQMGRESVVPGGFWRSRYDWKRDQFHLHRRVVSLAIRCECRFARDNVGFGLGLNHDS